MTYAPWPCFKPCYTGAHRVAFMLAGGAIDDGAVIRHTCDNPACVNPAHLLSGRNIDNVRDMWRRGREPVAWPNRDACRATLLDDERS